MTAVRKGVHTEHLIYRNLPNRELPAEVADAAKGAETAQAFLNALGPGKAQLLLYNISGETKIEGDANAQELRAALAAKAS